MIEETQLCDTDLSSREARAKRLLQIRNMANLTRTELCNSLDLSSNTYNSWEQGRFGGLSQNGAEKIISRVAKEGVVCSIDWLLFGRGLSPYVIPSFSGEANQKDELTPQQIIIHEINLLNTFYPNVIFAEVVDDAMHPEYSVGDIVAGIKVFGKAINELNGTNCIIHTKNNRHLIRRLRVNEENGLYNLFFTNINTTVNQPVEYNVEIESAAKICRRYTPIKEKKSTKNSVDQ